jgi:acetyl/propionyl-CoA carboxylase alpha subunit
VKFVATVGTEARTIDVSGRDGRFRLTMDDQVWEVEARFTESGVASLLIDGASYDVGITREDGLFVVDVGGERYDVSVEDESRYLLRVSGGAGSRHGGQVVKATMTRRVTHVSVAVGDAVVAGTPLLVIEAMKMENEFRAAGAGTVKEVRVESGQAVNAGDVLMVIE